MERLGVPFHRDGEGRLATRPFGAASQPRTCYVADITGQALLHVLFEQLLRHEERIDRYEEWFVTRLLLDDDGACAGCIARDVRGGELRVLQAKSVILATGGAGQCFQPTTNAFICTGDGVAQAYRIGAPLMDMEFNQYHPTTLARVGILITEGARGEGAHLYNARGERFMESLRAQQARARLARRRLPRRADRDQRGPRVPRRHGGAGHHQGSAQAHAGGAARDRQHRARLRRRRHHPRADPHLPGDALHDGRRQGRRRTAPRPCPASTPPGRPPASRCTAPTGWAATRCSTR